MAKVFAMFVVNRDGLTLFSRNLAPGKIHPDLVTSFLTAIRSLVGEISPSEAGGLRSIEAQDFTILVEPGEKVFGALLIDHEDAIARGCLKAMVREFERRYGRFLEDWDGDVSLFEPFGEICDRILSVIALSSYHVPKIGGWAEGDVRIPRDLWYIMRLIDGRKTIAEIAREAGLGVEETMERTKRLLEMGLIDVDVVEPVRFVVSTFEEALNRYLLRLRELLGIKLTSKILSSAMERWGRDLLAQRPDGRVSASDVDRIAWLHLPGEVYRMLDELLDLLCQEAAPILGRLAMRLKSEVRDELLTRHKEDLLRFQAIGGGR